MSTKSVKINDEPKITKSSLKNKTIEKFQQKKLEQFNLEKKKFIQIIYTLQSELFSLKKKIQNSSQLEQDLKLYQSKCTSLETEIEKYKKEILDLKEKYNEEIRNKDMSHIDELRKLKNENEVIKVKIGMTNDLTREKNGLLKAFNIVLNEKNDLMAKHDKNLRQIKIDTEMKLTKLKNKLIDSVNETQAKATELNIEHMNVSSKLIMLQNHQLLIQLEYQEQELNNLISKNEILEKKINTLKKDIEIHKEVEISLAEKNKKLIKELNKLKETENKDNEKDNDKILSSNSSGINLGGISEKTNLSSNKTIQLENKVINLEKKLQVKQKEFNDIKEKSDYFEKILKNYEKKYTGLFKYFEECLKMFFNDEELKNNKELNIDIDLMKKGDFSGLNEKEKYSTLIILMKYLMPLIYSTESLNDFNNLNNINLKFYSKKKKIKISKNSNNGYNINQNIFKKIMSKKNNMDNSLLYDEFENL